MFLHAVENLEFTTIESLWREFWRCQDTLDDCEEEKYLSKYAFIIFNLPMNYLLVLRTQF